MTDDWKKDPRLKAMNPEKLELLEQFAQRLSQADGNHKMEVLLELNLEAQKKGVSFTANDTKRITSILTSHMSPAEKKRADLIQMIAKKMAGPR